MPHGFPKVQCSADLKICGTKEKDHGQIFVLHGLDLRGICEGSLRSKENDVCGFLFESARVQDRQMTMYGNLKGPRRLVTVLCGLTKVSMPQNI